MCAAFCIHSVRVRYEHIVNGELDVTMCNVLALPITCAFMKSAGHMLRECLSDGCKRYVGAHVRRVPLELKCAMRCVVLRFAALRCSSTSTLRDKYGKRSVLYVVYVRAVLRATFMILLRILKRCSAASRRRNRRIVSVKATLKSKQFQVLFDQKSEQISSISGPLRMLSSVKGSCRGVMLRSPVKAGPVKGLSSVERRGHVVRVLSRGRGEYVCCVLKSRMSTSEESFSSFNHNSQRYYV
jgi:hypothetical protein